MLETDFVVKIHFEQLKFGILEQRVNCDRSSSSTLIQSFSQNHNNNNNNNDDNDNGNHDADAGASDTI